MYGPVFMHCSATESKYASWLDNAISTSLKLAVVVQTQEDNIFLSKEFERNRWKVQILKEGSFEKNPKKPGQDKVKQVRNRLSCAY